MRDRDVTRGEGALNVLLLILATVWVMTVGPLILADAGKVIGVKVIGPVDTVVQAATPLVYDTIREQHDEVTTIRLVHYRGTGTCGIVASGLHYSNGVSVAIAAHPVPCPWAVRAPAPVER